MNVQLVQTFLACCVYADRCWAKFIPAILYRFYNESTIQIVA